MDVIGDELSPRLLWLLMLISGSATHIVRVNVTLGASSTTTAH